MEGVFVEKVTIYTWASCSMSLVMLAVECITLLRGRRKHRVVRLGSKTLGFIPASFVHFGSFNLMHAISHITTTSIRDLSRSRTWSSRQSLDP